jgi:hypothetical protein
MQLLKLVVFNISIETCATHSVGIVLVRDRTVLARTGVPRRDHTFLHDASVMRGGAVVMCVVSSEAPVANLPQGTVIFIMVGQVLVTFEAVRERGGGPGPLMLLTREEANASLQDCSTLETVASIFIDPL